MACQLGGFLLAGDAQLLLVHLRKARQDVRLWSEIQAQASSQGADFYIVHETGSTQLGVLAFVGCGQREPRTIAS